MNSISCTIRFAAHAFCVISAGPTMAMPSPVGTSVARYWLQPVEPVMRAPSGENSSGHRRRPGRGNGLVVCGQADQEPGAAVEPREPAPGKPGRGQRDGCADQDWRKHHGCRGRGRYRCGGRGRRKSGCGREQRRRRDGGKGVGVAGGTAWRSRARVCRSAGGGRPDGRGGSSGRFARRSFESHRPRIVLERQHRALSAKRKRAALRSWARKAESSESAGQANFVVPIAPKRRGWGRLPRRRPLPKLQSA